MQNHAAGEQQDAEARDLNGRRLDDGASGRFQRRDPGSLPDARKEGDQRENQVGSPAIGPLRCEAEHEGEQVGGERQDPQKGNTGDVDTQLVLSSWL